MKKIVLVFCSSILLISCNNKQTNSKEEAHDFAKDDTTLYVSTIYTLSDDSTKVKELSQESALVEKIKKLPKVRTDKTKPLIANHFAISLNPLESASGYLAQKIVAKPDSDNGNSKKEYIAVDWCGGPNIFRTPAEFLDFVSDHGYKLTSQTKDDNGMDYIFDRK